MATTAAELFGAFYRIGGAAADLSGVRVHAFGCGALCRGFGALALTLGSDIYFDDGAFAPNTRKGLWLLAHEVAHVVQQRRGPVQTLPGAGGFLVGPAGTHEEHEADAAADAVLAGRPFVFAESGLRLGAGSSSGVVSPAGTGRGFVVQRYMTWEHCLLGDLDPGLVHEAALAVSARHAGPDTGLKHLESQYLLLEELGGSPQDVDEERLRAGHPGLETLRLPGSGLVVTLGELNILPDYVSHPADIETASADFLMPLIQSIRAWNIGELRQVAGQPRLRAGLPGALRYPQLRGLAEVYEAVEVDALGRRCGLQPWELYSSVVGRNATHFAPFSWYRWQSFHLMARELVGRAAKAPDEERDTLRARARIYAGYADHFLQDSYAAGHLINKTLVMQWYLEWLSSSRTPVTDQRLLAEMAADKQPFLHGPGYYVPEISGADGRYVPGGGTDPRAAPDPQAVVEAPTLDERIRASGVLGDTEQERREAYRGYLAMLGSSVAQLAAGLVHGHFNRRSLVVAAGADGSPYRLQGDRTLLVHGEGALRVAEAAAASRRAIAELLSRGGTDVTSREIFEGFPDHVEQEGVLLGLREWHDTSLRELCFHELFGRKSTRTMKSVLSVVSRRFGVPSPDVETLRGESGE